MEGQAVEAAQFGAEEYFVIVAMLALSLLVGVYFSFWSPQGTYSDYMLGGREMGVFPVAMSQVASHISGLAIVGNPAEVYSYGSLFALSLLTDIIVPYINITTFLPIFYNLQLNSLYEYLELRFNHTARVTGSLIFTFSQIIYLPAIIYVPALVLNQVSGVSVHVGAVVICAVCIFYTTFGGLKAVLWTDAVQNMFSLLAVLFIIYLGVVQLGGVSDIFHVNKDGGRLELFYMELSPFVRVSFWSMIAGNIGNWVCNLMIHPGAVQRSLSVPTLAKAKRAILWTAFGVFLVHAITIFLGLVLYARYHGCDPVATGEIKKTGQLMPLYVMEVTRGYPGLAGLFVSGVLSAALSSMSSAINTMAGALYEDLVEFVYRGKKQSDAKQSFIMKTISLLLGVLCVCLVLAVEKTDSLFQIGMALYGVTNGALLTLFLMGIFIPRANSKGAVAGALSSLALMAWIVGKAQYSLATGAMKYPGKHTSVDLCPRNYTSDPGVLSRLQTFRGEGTPVVADSSVPLLYQMSYMYYTVCGTLVGLSVGVLVSLATRPPNLRALDKHLFSPHVHHLLPLPRPKSNSVRFAEEEFKLIKIPASRTTDTGEDEEEEPRALPEGDVNPPEQSNTLKTNNASNETAFDNR